MKAASLLRIPTPTVVRCTALLCVVALIATATACGAVGYVSRVTLSASSSVEAAEVVNAEQYAPYEYTRAKEYLHKAREEASYADFQAANRFGKLAHEAAVEARKLSVARAANKNDTDWMPPESLRKGKGAGDSKSDGDAEEADEAADADSGDGDSGDGDSDSGDGDSDSDSGEGDGDGNGDDGDSDGGDEQ